MRDLVLAFYGEGPADARFLPIVAQRTAGHLLLQAGRGDIEVHDLTLLRPTISGSDHAHAILDVAHQGRWVDAIILHADADHRSPQAARAERFRPGLALVHSRPSAEVCRQLVPLIPVRMTEAWMLADSERLCRVLGTNKDAVALGLPLHPAEVERDLDPKRTFQAVVNAAVSARRGRRVPPAYTYAELLARQIRLTLLDQIPAYRQFVADLTTTLEALGFLS